MMQSLNKLRIVISRCNVVKSPLHRQFISKHLTNDGAIRCCRALSLLTAYQTTPKNELEFTKTFPSLKGSNVLLQQVRTKKRPKPPPKKKSQQVEEESDSDDEEEETETGSVGEGPFSVFFEEDKNFPSNFKEILVNAKTMRIDKIASTGLATTGKKIEELFLDSKLLLNGNKVTKKSTQVTEGDYIDVVSGSDPDGNVRVRRVRVVNVALLDTESSKVALRVWRSAVTLE